MCLHVHKGIWAFVAGLEGACLEINSHKNEERECLDRHDMHAFMPVVFVLAFNMNG